MYKYRTLVVLQLILIVAIACASTATVQNVHQWHQERATEKLIDALNSSAPNVPEAAARALGQIGDSRGVEPLILALTSQSPDLREEAAKALGEIRDPRAVEPLRRALGDQYCTAGGARFTDLKTGRTISRVSESCPVREAATAALKKMGYGSPSENK